MTWLLAELKELWQYYSVRLAAFAAFIVAWLISDPTIFTTISAAVPDEWRPLAAVLGGFITFSLPTIARRLPQPPK